MDTNLQIELEEKYEEIYPMSENFIFERINPKNKIKMKVNYTVLGIEFVIKLDKPKEYVSLLILANNNRKDARIEALVLEHKGFMINQEDLKKVDFAGNLGSQIEKLHHEGEIWLEGEKFIDEHSHKDPHGSFWSMFKKILK